MTKLILIVSLAANLVLAIYAIDLKGPRLLAALRARVEGKKECTAQMAARDDLWRRYVASLPVPEPAIMPLRPTLLEQQTLEAQRDFYYEAAQELRLR